MDIERKITKKHIMIGIASLVLVIGALILILTTCGNDSNKENLVVEETTTEITSTTTTATETTTTKATTTTTLTSTTEITSATSEATTTTTTITTEEIEDVPVINDEPSYNEEPEETPVVKPVETTKAPVIETKPATTTTAKPIETEPPVVETQAPAASCNHYYGEVNTDPNFWCSGCNMNNWYWFCCVWEYKEDGYVSLSSLMTDQKAYDWVYNTGYMKPTSVGIVNIDGYVYLG